MFVFIWEGVVNPDYTAGDLVIVAESLEHARALWDERRARDEHTVYFEEDCRFFGMACLGRRHQPDIRNKEPDCQFPAYAGFVYCGPGGG